MRQDRAKPRIFLASSSEAGDLLTELFVLISKGDWCLVRPWNFSTFEAGKSFFDSLYDNTRDIDFAVILYTGDDQTSSRGVTQAAPRDNVIFELGFFLARLGPEAVIVVSPINVPKIPSDYSGYAVLSYDPSTGSPTEYLTPAAAQVKLQLKKKWQSRQEPTTDKSQEPVKSIDIVYKRASGGIIPIYRDLASGLDWFAELEANISPPFRYLNSRLSYYGPDLAKFWFQRARQDAANREMTTVLQGELLSLLHSQVDSSVNIIDLGIGDFEKGHIVIDFLLRQPSVKTINYFPLDVSYEMLALALRTKADHYAAATLQAIQQNGSITAINAPFSQLSRYQHLFSPPSKNIFLLLGNTLGNEAVEIQTLHEISRGMNVGDILVIEVQLIENEPPTSDEDNKTIQKHKDFYCGPFWALGYDIRDIDLSIKSDSADAYRGIPAVTFLVTAKLKKPLSAAHPSFSSGRLYLAAGESVIVYLIRLYQEGAVEGFLPQAGFEVIDVRTSTNPNPRSRRFSYVVAKKVD